MNKPFSAISPIERFSPPWDRDKRIVAIRLNRECTVSLGHGGPRETFNALQFVPRSHTKGKKEEEVCHENKLIFVPDEVSVETQKAVEGEFESQHGIRFVRIAANNCVLDRGDKLPALPINAIELCSLFNFPIWVEFL
jgi:hypothetical protein